MTRDDNDTITSSLRQRGTTTTTTPNQTVDDVLLHHNSADDYSTASRYNSVAMKKTTKRRRLCFPTVLLFIMIVIISFMMISYRNYKIVFRDNADDNNDDDDGIRESVSLDNRRIHNASVTNRDESSRWQRQGQKQQHTKYVGPNHDDKLRRYVSSSSTLSSPRLQRRHGTVVGTGATTTTTTTSTTITKQKVYPTVFFYDESCRKISHTSSFSSSPSTFCTKYSNNPTGKTTTTTTTTTTQRNTNISSWHQPPPPPPPSPTSFTTFDHPPPRRTIDKNGCVRVSDWQYLNYLNCNSFHELSLLRDDGADDDATTTTTTFLAAGGKRVAWGIVRRNGGIEDETESFVLKTLRYDNTFKESTYLTHQRDAIVNERLASSRRTVDIYGFCGQSVMNERGDATADFFFGSSTIRRRHLSWRDRLVYARDAAGAVADVHGIVGGRKRKDEEGEEATWHDGGAVVPFVHRDVRPWNFVLVKMRDGEKGDDEKMTYKLKIHDFNAGFFQKWNVTSESLCQHKIPSCNQHRSPEECLNHPLTEKVDVYTLGNIIYLILTGFQPYQYPHRLGKTSGGALVSKGIVPKIPSYLLDAIKTNDERNNTSRSGNDKNADDGEDEIKNAPAESVAISTMMKVIAACHAFHPGDRPSANAIERELSVALTRVTKMKS